MKGRGLRKLLGKCFGWQQLIGSFLRQKRKADHVEECQRVFQRDEWDELQTALWQLRCWDWLTSCAPQDDGHKNGDVRKVGRSKWILLSITFVGWSNCPIPCNSQIYRIFSRSLVKNLDPMRSTLIACKIGPFWSPCPWRNWTCLLDVWKMHEDAFWLQPNFSHSATLGARCYWNPLPHKVILVSSILWLFDYVWTMVEVPSLQVELLSFAIFSGLWWCGIFQRSQQLCHGFLVNIWTRHCLIDDTWFFLWGKKHMNFIYQNNLSHMSSLKRPLWLFY